MKIIHLGTNAPIKYEVGDLGTDPVMAPDQPAFATYVDIHVSPDSSLLEAVSEVKKIWDIQTHEAIPLWIGANAEAAVLASVLNAEFGGAVEMRVIA